MKTLRIVDWSKHYEKNRTRELKTMRWTPVPNRFDGDRISSLIEDGGAIAYGGWCAMLHIAGRCDPRGLLVRSRVRGQIPHTAKSISVMTGLEENAIKTAIKICLDVGLIEEITISQPCATIHENENENEEEENREDESEEIEIVISDSSREGISEEVGPDEIARLSRPRPADWEIDDSSPDHQPRRRKLQFQIWLLAASELWAGKGDSQQRLADKTCSKAMFDEIWPPEIPTIEGEARVAIAIELAQKARERGKKPMAYLTKRLSEEMLTCSPL